MSFASEITHNSKSLPGVRFTVRRMGWGRRSDLDMQTLKLRQRMREIEQEYPPQTKEEIELTRQLQAATKKATSVPEAEQEAVLVNEVMPLEEELRRLPLPTETRKARAAADTEYAAVDAQIRPFWIRAGLISIEGGDVAGMTADQLLDYGPPALASEIYTALIGDGRLTVDESKNSPSPSISDAPGDGKSASTNAAGASSTSEETASPSIQAA
jgi:hypothetical protein